MSGTQTFYDDDVAYIHDVGFSGYAEGSAGGLLEILRVAGIVEGTIVDLGCGGGVWSRHVVQAGYQAIGIDFSPAMVQLARGRVPAAEFTAGCIWSYPIPPCRAVTALGEVVCYRADVGATFNLRALAGRVYEALSPGGLLIFDVAEVGLDRNRQQSFAEGDDWACLVRYEYEEKRNRLHRHITAFRKVNGMYRRSHERHVLQLYEGRAVADMLRKAGFRVRTVRKFGKQPLPPKRVGFIARKP